MEFLQELLMTLAGFFAVIAIPFVVVAFVKWMLAWAAYYKEIFEDEYPEAYERIYEFAVEAVAYVEDKGLTDEFENKLDQAVAYAQREVDLRGWANLSTQN